MIRSRRMVAVVVVGVLAGAVAGCAGREPGVDPLAADAEFVGVAADAARDDAMAAASVRLATQLLDLGEPVEDVVVSPASLQLALALLREGATGRVAEEIDAAAGLTGSQAVADLRAALAEYEGDVAGIDPENPPESPLLHIADSAFVQEDYPVEQTFLDRVASYHSADVFPTDFTSATAKPALDAWVERETGGLLEECPITPTPDTRLVLMDAVTFGATWRSQFDANATWDGPFTRADGTQATVPFMHQVTAAPYLVGDGWVAVELAYTDDFVMRLVLPDAGPDTTVPADTWEQVHADLGASERRLALAMPSWETDATLQLTDALDDLGLGSLRAPQGDLDGIFRDAFVSAVAQGATITVAERGTVAAAVTAIGLEAGAAPEPALEVRFDRPFEYQVVHPGTGLVLFAGRVLDPSAE